MTSEIDMSLFVQKKFPLVLLSSHVLMKPIRVLLLKCFDSILMVLVPVFWTATIQSDEFDFVTVCLVMFICLIELSDKPMICFDAFCRNQ